MDSKISRHPQTLPVGNKNITDFSHLSRTDKYQWDLFLGTGARLNRKACGQGE